MQIRSIYQEQQAYIGKRKESAMEAAIEEKCFMVAGDWMKFWSAINSNATHTSNACKKRF